MSRVNAYAIGVMACALLPGLARAEEFSLAPKVMVSYAQSDPAIYRIDPNQEYEGENHVMSSVPAAFSGLVINNFVGANRFYSAGITGQNSIVANVEAGHIWSGHETLGHVTNFLTGSGGLGETDRHATWVGMIIGGRNGGPVQGEFETGIAMGTDLRSGSVASNWNPSTPTPRYSLSFAFTGNSMFTVMQSEFGTADVVNSSWGSTNPTGTVAFAIGIDGLAKSNPRTTMVISAGNSGPNANTVSAPASGYNSIAVAALGNANSYDTVASFSSRGPQDYSDPVHGLITGVRAAVDIAAPGQNISSAYYGGETGGNRPALGGAASGILGSSDTFSTSVSGTSFAAPMVSGGAALLVSASRNTPALAANINSRDSRVIKAVLLNSATKTTGWNNGQVNVGGVIETTRALDYSVGAGALNLDKAYDQYLSGTTDVAGLGGGIVDSIGWDFASVEVMGSNDYLISTVLQGNTTFAATLTWFRQRTFGGVGTFIDEAYRDLDLQVWNATFTQMVAQSRSTYENVEHLSFTLPGSGIYAIRVKYAQTIFGAPGDESYGLSWSGIKEVLIPEPAGASLLLLAGFLGRRRRR